MGHPLERRPTNHLLDTAETPFQVLVETAPNAIVGVDGNGRIVLVNSQAEVDDLMRPALALVTGHLDVEPVRVLEVDERQSFVTGAAGGFQPGSEPAYVPGSAAWPASP